MRTVLILAALAAGVPSLAPAQGRECFVVQGGRVTCVESYEAGLDRLQRQARHRTAAGEPEPQAAAPAEAADIPYITPAQRRLVDAVTREVLRGRCDKAESLALKAGDKALASAAVLRCTPAAIQPGG